MGLRLGPNGKPNDNGTAICRLCSQSQSAKNGNTSNLLSHLRTSHPLVHSRVKTAMAGNYLPVELLLSMNKASRHYLNRLNVFRNMKERESAGGS